MTKNIVVVESPAKAKTIKKYLGKDFEVLASYGHVRDLIPKEGAVDPENNFAMHYEAIARNAKHVNQIASALKKADALYLAPDPDREGEAIAWHLLELLEKKKVTKNKHIARVTFNQITKKAIIDAMGKPRDISMELVNAQQARRALDYLVGFNLSPLLWRKINPGLSAGRVQSPALRLIVERELEIEAFKAQEYWTIHADCQSEQFQFESKLIELEGEKLKQFSIVQENDAKQAVKTLNEAANNHLTVIDVKQKERKRYPAPPFITSTLQQEASRKLNFSAQQTMRIAQQLYEGVDIGGGDGSVGLITYMRTDSTNLAPEAVNEARACIEKIFGKENLPATGRIYKTKAKNAQEAHEAIRPTSFFYEPKKIKSRLTDDQYRLYELIWKRTIACQMIEAILDTVTIDLAAGNKGCFRVSGSTIKFSGFMSVYQESEDDKKAEKEKILPPLKKGDTVSLLEIRPAQHFTEPPPRYTEASLVKALEQYGIGRPSTYASIVATLRNRQYVKMDRKRFKPTDVGRVVNRFLTNYFTQYVDYDFTAHLENDLDDVANGEKQWIPVLEHFWQPFIDKVKHTQDNVKRSDVRQELIDEKCPECGTQLSIRLGKSGRFIGCTAFPDCKYTRPMETDEKEEADVLPDRKCPKCDKPLVIKRGPYGKFIGCSGYPDCRHIEKLNKPEDTGVTCPECKKGNLLKRQSRRGKVFYSCSAYPKCKYAIWDEPIAENCPTCNFPILTIKTTKKDGRRKVCPQKECDFAKKGD